MVRNIRTADYSEERRLALGVAVQIARREAGFRWRTDMRRAHPQVSVSSLKYLELGHPVVGELALRAVAAALSKHFTTWTEDTPREILDGGAPPELIRRSEVSPIINASKHSPEFWEALRTEVDPAKYKELWEMYQEGKRAQEELRERDSL